MENVASRMQSGELGNIRPNVVIADSYGTGAIEKATKLEIPTEVLRKQDFR